MKRIRKIYSLLLVKDEADIVALTLADACRWSDKVIVIDNGSSDGTWELVQRMAREYSTIVPFLRYEGPFHIGLRAKAFRTFRKEMRWSDWWCVRLDADEFYPGDVRGFLDRVPWYCGMVKKRSTDYVVTHEDIDEGLLSGDFMHDKEKLHYCLPQRRAERRFVRHVPWLVWLPRWRYPHPWSPTWKYEIAVEHYQYRSVGQQHRHSDNRQNSAAEGSGTFSHEHDQGCQDYLYRRTDVTTDDALPPIPRPDNIPSVN